MKVIAIIQARMGSSRLPGKVMKKINGKTVIELLHHRLSKSKKINEIVVATSNNEIDKTFRNFLLSKGVACEAGDEFNVLKRFVDVSKKYKADVVVRISGDCPLIDPILVDEIIDHFIAEKADYSSNVNPPTFPDGLDTEVFNVGTLYDAHERSTDIYDLEHVTPFIRRKEDIKKTNFISVKDNSQLRLTLDELSDFIVIKGVYDYFSPRIDFSWQEVVDLYKIKPVIFNANMSLKRNEGANMGKGQKLWKRAKSIIPGGNMLLSKKPEMFLPGAWPAYFSKSKGCSVWDLDGKKYTDMSIMGIGTNILGYGQKDVDNAVLETIKKGNMSTLNCPEEVYLAEKLIEINPWSNMVRFARTGGEANAIAIRIARAATGKDNVAICGYHGWHDWYLSANLSSSDKLQDHLLPGLKTSGVPQNLKGSVHPFHYNNFEELKTLVEEHDIGTIKMEVERNNGPEDDFLLKVRKLATDKNIVLIFDECTSGFRETYGGLALKYGVEPDMAMYGKALGNGYAITATVGKSEVMEAAQSSFISSTFWTERIGPSAAIKTLQIMEERTSWKEISNIGSFIKEKWAELAQIHGIEIEISGLLSLPIFSIKSKNNLAYKTLITQEMLKKGFLASNSVYVCTEHNEKIVNNYIEELDKIFKLIKKCEDGFDIGNLLDGPVCQSGFSRLN